MADHHAPQQLRQKIYFIASLVILVALFFLVFYRKPPPAETAVPFHMSYGPKGIGDAWQNGGLFKPAVNLEHLTYDWYYDWSFSYQPQRSADPKYVRMVWCDAIQETDVYGQPHTIAEIAQDDFQNGRSGRVWLVYNEPDAPGVQCGETFANDPVAAAQHYSAVYDMIKENDPHARVFAGGLLWLSSQETRIWWWSFIDTLALAGELDKIEGVHIHLYPTITDQPVRGEYGDPATCQDGRCLVSLVQAANDWYQHIHVGSGLGDRPIWITEAGWLFCDGYDHAWIEHNFMKPLSQWFTRDPAWPHPDISTNPGYTAIAWYVTRDPDWFPCTYLLDNAAPTPLGHFWNQLTINN
ncbi:MAG: hypothetical protein IAF02_22370 [Anaerolineae bacterium]|nr:hypothetical protein [Anaerolineae bacterium]